MRFIFLTSLFLFFSSCGIKDPATKEPLSSRPCMFNNLLNRCDPIQNGETTGVEILESVVDVPIKLKNQEIIFLSDKNSFAVGQKINCSISVKNEQIYRFTLKEDKLFIISSEGSFEFDKLSGGNDIYGQWVWRGRSNEGILELRQLSFLDNSKLIIRKTCES